MVLGLYDIRRLGYLKIASMFFKTEEERLVFSQRIALLNTEAEAINVAPFGFPNKFKKLNLKDSDYIGMVSFMHYVEPMIDDVDPDNVCKRKFRNAYVPLWEDFCSATGLSASKTIATYGLRLAFISEPNEKILTFYNAVLLWHVLTRSECSILEQYSSVDVLLDRLVCCSAEEFINDLICDFS